MLHARRPIRTTNAKIAEIAGILKLKIYHTASTNDIPQPEILERDESGETEAPSCKCQAGSFKQTRT